MEQKLEGAHAIIEQDIARLSAIVKNSQERSPEAQRAVIHNALRQDLALPPISVRSVAETKKSAEGNIPVYAQDELPEVKLKIEQLVDIAFHKGTFAGAKEAEKKGVFYLKAYHDVLTDHVYEALKKKGEVL